MRQAEKVCSTKGPVRCADGVVCRDLSRTNLHKLHNLHNLIGFRRIRYTGQGRGADEWPNRRAHNAIQLFQQHGDVQLAQGWPRTRSYHANQYHSNRLSRKDCHLKTDFEMKRCRVAPTFGRLDAASNLPRKQNLRSREPRLRGGEC